MLVQTIAPEARAIVYAARHDSHGFIAGELERRRALRYPPYSHLIRVVCSADTSAQARVAAGEIRELLARQLDSAAPRAGVHAREAPGIGRGLDTHAGERAVVLGPAALFRLRGRERSVLVVKAANRRDVVKAVGETVARVAGGRAHAGVSFSVDVDPQ